MLAVAIIFARRELLHISTTFVACQELFSSFLKKFFEVPLLSCRPPRNHPGSSDSQSMIPFSSAFVNIFFQKTEYFLIPVLSEFHMPVFSISANSGYVVADFCQGIAGVIDRFFPRRYVTETYHSA